ncbi:MAG: hypothetical protein H6577_01545 [Lewinellaceae bacterium]|nr:hypothetical protein [Saprospiraceae bacterium]MCB9336790.1 hypothetical protein [Lewinellaceae bacterium]
MSITIQLPKHLEQRLREKANQEGVVLERLISKLLEDRFPPSSSQTAVGAKEAELLKKINEGFPADFWEKYFQLIEKRQQEKLTPTDQNELIAYSDKIEKSNAHRMKYLLDLAELKNVDLDDLMNEMEIHPKSHA